MAAVPVAAAEIILSRETRGVAIYIKMPLTEVEPLFGQPVEGLLNYEGALTFEDLSQGTFEQADALAQDVQFTINGASAPFAAMSMMIHPASDPVPFHDPLDALMAISVCGVPLPKTPPPLSELTWIGGWYAPGITELKGLSIQFPITERPPIDMHVASYLSRQGSERSDIRLDDGGTLAIDVPTSFARFLFGN